MLLRTPTKVRAALRPSSVVVLATTLVTAASCGDLFAPGNGRSAATRASGDIASILTNGRVLVDTRRVIPDAYIVVFDQSVADVHGRAAALAQATGARVSYEYTRALKGFAARMSAQAAAVLATQPGVAFVEQDQLATALDTLKNATWGLDRIDQSSLPLNGTYITGVNGAGVNVYIIDTGIRRTHSQFGGRVVPAFTSIDDAYGADGCNLHGTHVAGTVGGATVGVANGVTLYSVRVLDCGGSGSYAGVIAGVDWVTANRKLPAVANMSLGGGLSTALNTAVENSISAGVTYSVAAGNSAANACNYSPSSTGPALTIGASSNTDYQASFSNWGSCLDLYAPGVSIYSAINTDDYAMGSLSGTSMATPHVAGAAALYLQQNPTASPAQVGQALAASATSGILKGLSTGSPNLLVRVNASASTTPPPSSPAPAPNPDPAPAPINQAPQAGFIYSCPANKNVCTFDASMSRDDVAVVRYSWTFGDGTPASSLSTATVGHTYTAKGDYVVTLTVYDAAGLAGSAQRTISVRSLAK
jgi:subtilisin family serine protease